MLLADQIGEVKRFRLARTLLGRAWYFTAAYLVDDLMIDTGCAHTAGELAAALEGCSIGQIVNKIAYLGELERKVMELHARGMSIPAISKHLFGREKLIAYFTLGQFSSRNLVTSFVEDQ